MAMPLDAMVRALQRSPLALLICTLLPLASALGACGSPSSAPPPTSTPRPAAVSRLVADRHAVTTAQQFLRAFRRDNKGAMIGLMGPSLRARNRRELVAQMLGAQDQPSRVKIVRAHTFRGRHGGWTRVLVRLQFDHGAVLDRLVVVQRAKRYRISRIERGSGPRG